MPVKRILPLSLGVFVALTTFFYFAVQSIAHSYVDRFWGTHSNGGRCLIAQDGARFMREFAMFADADQLDRLGEISCVANFRQEAVLMPRQRPADHTHCRG
jgi:hypothetical protein